MILNKLLIQFCLIFVKIKKLVCSLKRHDINTKIFKNPVLQKAVYDENFIYFSLLDK